MSNLNDILITDEKFKTIINHEIKVDGDKFTIGVRDPKGITWGEKRKLVNQYYDMDMKNPESTKLNMEKGDLARYRAFLKYIKDDEGEKPVTEIMLRGLPSEFMEAVEEFIPSMQSMMLGISKSLKKK